MTKRERDMFLLVSPPLHLASPCASAPRSQQTPLTLTSAPLSSWRHVRGSWQRNTLPPHHLYLLCLSLFQNFSIAPTVRQPWLGPHSQQTTEWWRLRVWRSCVRGCLHCSERRTHCVPLWLCVCVCVCPLKRMLYILWPYADYVAINRTKNTAPNQSRVHFKSRVNK